MRVNWEKYISRLTRGCAVGAAGAALALSGANASADVVNTQLINVDFNGSGGGGGDPKNPGTFDGDLSIDAATMASVNWTDNDGNNNNDVWNGIDDADTLDGGTQAALVDSGGTATGVSVTWGAFTANYHNYCNGICGNSSVTLGPNADGFLTNDGTPTTVTLSGLTANGFYGLTAGGTLEGADITIGGSTQTYVNWNDANLSNFTEFASVQADGSGDLVLNIATSTGNGNNMMIGSIQLTAIPEPGSAMLLGSALVGVGLFPRRRKTDTKKS